MKEVAKATKVPVIALAQLNREGTRGGGKARRPTMADLRESGGIEADADVIVLLHREGYYDPAKNDGKWSCSWRSSGMGRRGSW